jgi:hypothetical protein
MIWFFSPWYWNIVSLAVIFVVFLPLWFFPELIHGASVARHWAWLIALCSALDICGGIYLFYFHPDVVEGLRHYHGLDMLPIIFLIYSYILLSALYTILLAQGKVEQY